MNEQLSILVLAGGEGRRLGGSKALHEILGKPMISHVIERLSPLSREIIISTKENGDELVRLFPWAEVVLDELELRAPIVGLMSSLRRVRTEYVAVVSCDSPMVSPEVMRVLFEHAIGRSGAVPLWPDGKIEPLQAVYRTEELLEKVLECWEMGDLRVRCAIELMEDISFVPMELLSRVDPDLSSFLNLNSREDIERVLGRLKMDD